MKPKLTSDKLRGGYYTPEIISKFLSKLVVLENPKKILEPSSGDGNFIISLIKEMKLSSLKKKQIENRLYSIEIIKSEYNKTVNRLKDYKINLNHHLNMDFFDFYKECENKKIKFDAIIGNPPFIRYQNFPKKLRELSTELLNTQGFKTNKLTNIWVHFLILSTYLLSNKGILAMVIPSEILQVKYAENVRTHMINFFEDIKIITFKKLLFGKIQQDVVLLICKKNSKAGFKLYQCNESKDLNTLDLNFKKKIPNIIIQKENEKWTKYFLLESEIKKLKKIFNSNKVAPLSKYLNIDVGVVTGANDYFILNKAKINQYSLSKKRKIISKSNQLKGIFINGNDFLNIQNENVYLFNPNSKKISKKEREYIKFGEKNKINDGYKCSIRKEWFKVPTLWIPDAFVLRQVHDYPKIIFNEINATCTDTIHRASKKYDFDLKKFSAIFLNSLTFASTELMGRSYGGGVMTYEPSEVENFIIPNCNFAKVDVVYVDKLIREKKISDVLDYIDKIILHNQLKISLKDIKILRNIWQKLKNRRIQRNKK